MFIISLFSYVVMPTIVLAIDHYSIFANSVKFRENIKMPW